ncbi:MAG: hypothetical protein EOM59_10260 [Clostridia bacterium]|nr:hypothetical protein [Clostridia bacterium]
MNRTKKFFLNTASSSLQQFITLIVGFITPRVMLKFYGSEINGLISSISQFIAYFNLVEAGIAGAAIYALYKPLADNDHSAINGIVCSAKKFYTLSGYIFVSLTVGLAVIYPVFVKTESLAPSFVCILVLVLGVSGALEFFTLAKFRVLLTADQKTYVISAASTLAIVLNTVLIIVLANLHVNIVVIRAISLLSVFLRSAILMVYVKVKYKYINFKEPPNDKALDKRWDALLLQILGSVQLGTPVVLATVFTNLKMVSVYSVFNMIMGGIDGLLSIYLSGLSASFGEIIALKEKKTLQKVYKEFEYSYYCLITVVYSTAMVTIMFFIKLYTKGINDTNYNIPIIGILFVVNGLLYNLKTPQGTMIISAGLFKETKWQTISQAAIIILAGIILAPIFGLPGILIGSILSNIFRDIDLLFFVPKNVTKLRVKGTALRWLNIMVNISIIWLPFLFIKTEPQNYLEWVIFAAAVCIYAIAVVCVNGLIFERKELMNVVIRVLSIIGVKK